MICNLIEFKLSCKINQIEKNENVKNYCFKNMLNGLLTKKINTTIYTLSRQYLDKNKNEK